MRELIPVEAVPGWPFVDALRRAWDAGDAVLPIDPRLPAPARAALLATMRPEEPVEDGDALVVATSGTTGEPKGVVLTHDALRASALATNARLSIDPDADRWLSCLPLAHVGGLSVVTRAVLTSTALTFAPDEAATLVSVVATQLHDLDVTRFRVVLLGGSAPPEHPPPNAVVTYGMTETASGVVYDGVPLDGVDVRERAGALQVRGPMLLRAYRDGHDPKDAEGWLATGDAGRVDPDGTIHIDGRLDEAIVTGGEKVWPEAVERVLRRCPGVLEVAVGGRPDERWGHRVVAWVVPGPTPPTLEALRDAVKAELPAYSAPKELELVSSLPRTPLGKLQRRRLR